VGGAPVTVYRELRRMADSETAHGLSVEFAAAHDAADAGDWAEYVNAQGGPFVCRDDLAVHTWYQASEDLNEYGKETMRIKGIYATEVGDDTPILTRLMQWKIVPKRAVDLGFEFKDASASSRSSSSVNNCTEPTGSEAAIDFTKPPTRAERRRIIKRLKEKPAQDQPEPDKYPPEVSHCTELEALKKSFFEISRLTLSDGEAVHLMKGHKIKVGGAFLLERYKRVPLPYTVQKSHPIKTLQCTGEKKMHTVA